MRPLQSVTLVVTVSALFIGPLWRPRTAHFESEREENQNNSKRYHCPFGEFVHGYGILDSVRSRFMNSILMVCHLWRGFDDLAAALPQVARDQDNHPDHHRKNRE